MMKAEYLSHFGSDEMVCDAARVSHAKLAANYTAEQNARLIRYMAKNGHDSPFFHPHIQFRITAPIFVARQMFRHNVGISRNEQSMRYVDEPLGYYIPSEWRSRPDKSVKQGSGDPLDVRVQYRIEQTYSNLLQTAEKAYEAVLEWGAAPEQARMLLPQSMLTQWIETGSIAAYSRICRLRLDNHTQAETRELAKQISNTIEPLFPVSWPVLLGAKE